MYKTLPKKSTQTQSDNKSQLPYQGLPTPKLPPEPVKPEPITNHHKIADLYKSMNPQERHQMLNVDLQQWPEEARTEFGKISQNYLKHGLTAQDSLDIWNASTGGPEFDNYDDQADFIDTLKRHKKWEPKGLNRGFKL